jgi:hypothetical protein
MKDCDANLAVALLDWLQAGTRLALIQKAIQSLRTDCAASPIAVTFDKKNLRALKTTDPLSDLDQVLATNLKILEMGKHLKSQASVDPSPASSLFLAPSQQVERRVSITDDSQICPVPSRCLLPPFVTVAQALRLQTSYNKHHKSSLLDAMELEFGFCRRSENTPATQLSRLLQLETYYAYEEYYEHALRDASVLTIRVLKVQPRAAVLDTGATSSASNDPAEITAFLPSNVLLKQWWDRLNICVKCV